MDSLLEIYLQLLHESVPVVGMMRIRTHETIARVLFKLGIDPRDRLHSVDQHAEYTACRADELPQYFELYRNGGLSDEEKCVLCCFLLEGLNEIAYKEEHQLHDAIFNALFDDEALHKAELDYWMDTDDPDETNWWPITKRLLRVRKSRAAAMTAGGSCPSSDVGCQFKSALILMIDDAMDSRLRGNDVGR